jgi:putative ABC transport system permease protein
MLQTIQSLLRAKTFTAAAVLSVALGIGAAATVFSVVNAILIRPFPYREPDRLVRVASVLRKEANLERGCSLLDIEDWNRRAKLVSYFGAYTSFDAQALGDGPAEAIRMTQLNQEAFRALGVEPVIGRWFEASEDRKGGAVNKAILSYDFWQTRYGSDPKILGRTVRTDVASFEIVGVMPPGFAFPMQSNFWTPMESWWALQLDTYGEKTRQGRWYETIALLKPGVSIQQAQQEMNSIAAQLEREYPKDNEGVGIRLIPMRDAEVGNVRSYLWLLLGAVALLLLICCANIANLMLARAVAQRRQFTIRAALGATRWSLAKVTLAESAVIGGLGALLGLAAAVAAVGSLPALLPDSIPFWMQFRVDWVVLGFSMALTVFSTLVFAILPVWFGSRVDVGEVLKQGSRGSAKGGKGRPLLVILEVTLCVVLLVGAAMLVQSFWKLRDGHPGFAPESLLLARITKFDKDGSRVERSARLAAYHEKLLGRLQTLPGVEAVSVGTRVPFAGPGQRSKSDLQVKGRSVDEQRFVLPVLGSDVSPSYFSTMKIPLRRGRLLDVRDTKDSPMVVVVNETGAKHLFPGRDPIGQELHWGTTISEADPWTRVVGVVGDVKNRAAEREAAIEVYYPITQWPAGASTYAIRYNGDATLLMPKVRSAIQETDPNASIVWIKTMEARIGETLWQQRLWGVMFLVFAVMALALAAVGLYGVLSYAIAQQTRDLAIRLALGALPSLVLRRALGNGLALVGAGVALGVPGAWMLAKAWSSNVDGLSPGAWEVYVGVTLLMLFVGILACWIPARRAAAVDPLVALREE